MSQDLPQPSDALDPPARGWRSSRLRLVACLLVVLGSLAFIAVRGLTGNFVYYLTPTDIVADHKAHVGERVRLGGYVVPGSVAQTTSTLTFTVTDDAYSISVSDTGSVPALFKAGQGVVLEGAMGGDGLFHSDTLLVQHDGRYRPPDRGNKPATRPDLGAGG
jgi:cytochrome c-type biogenesis protein CcmE